MQHVFPVSMATNEEYPTVLDYYFYEVNSGHNDDLVERRKELRDRDKNDLLYEMVSPDGIHFWHCNTPVSQPKAIEVENPQPFFHLNFVVRNHCVYKKKGKKNEFASFANYEYNLVFFPPQHTEIEWQPQDRAEGFVLNLTPGFLLKYMPEEHPFYQKIQSYKTSAKPFKISSQNLPVTPQVMAILLDILNCPLEKQYKRMFLKAKVIELLSVLLSQLEQFSTPQMATSLRQTDIRKMQEARELLHQNLQSPCSLIDLAHQVGTNENYLKKQFKMLYGNTVFGYIHDLRMQQAKQMIKEEQPLPVIAEAVGYKNVHHFATAFKKFFGYSPYAIKK